MNDAVIVTGSLEPRSAVGSIYLVSKDEIRIVTWRGKDEWESRWRVGNGLVVFHSIESPEGTVIDWGSKKSLKRFIPLRHFSMIESIANQEKFTLYDWELFR